MITAPAAGETTAVDLVHTQQPRGIVLAKSHIEPYQVQIMLQ